jgi:hypothetical protein
VASLKKTRDRDILKKIKKLLGEEKCALENENDNHFGTKFEFYNVGYFGTAST